MLNSKAVGGHANWDPLRTQAAAWTGQKIRSGELSPEDAAKHYGDFSNKYQASATHEQVPGAGTGHLDGIVDAPLDTRAQYHDAASWRNPKGQDSIYSHGGLLTEPSMSNVGAYTPSGTGRLEINPGEVARPLVQMDAANGSKALSPRDRGLLDTGESARAYVDVQNAGAWHKIVPGAKAGEQTGLVVAVDGSPSPEQMAKLSAIASSNGMFAVDTGRGVSFINDVYSDAGKARSGTSLNNELKKGLQKEIQGVVGDVPIERTKIESGYLDYEGAWSAGEGSGKATEKFLQDLDAHPVFADNIEPALREKARHNMIRDAEYSRRTGAPVREDIQRARQILIDEGREGLRKAIKDGVVLPAVAAAVLLPMTGELQSDSQSPGS